MDRPSLASALTRSIAALLRQCPAAAGPLVSRARLTRSIAALLRQCRSTSPDDRRVVVAQGTKRLLPDVAAYLGLPEHAALDRDLTRALRQPISELVMLQRTDDLVGDDEHRAVDTAWTVVRIVDSWVQETTIERHRPRPDDGMAPVGAFKL